MFHKELSLRINVLGKLGVKVWHPIIEPSANPTEQTQALLDAIAPAMEKLMPHLAEFCDAIDTQMAACLAVEGLGDEVNATAAHFKANPPQRDSSYAKFGVQQLIGEKLAPKPSSRKPVMKLG